RNVAEEMTMHKTAVRMNRDLSAALRVFRGALPGSARRYVTHPCYPSKGCTGAGCTVPDADSTVPDTTQVAVEGEGEREREKRKVKAERPQMHERHRQSGLIETWDDTVIGFLAAVPLGPDVGAVEHIRDSAIFLRAVDLCVANRPALKKIKGSDGAIIVGGRPKRDGTPETEEEALARLRRDCTQVVLFCLDLSLSIQCLRELGLPLPTLEGVRAGVARGGVTTGVLGSYELMFDVFGDTVNTAARLMGEVDPLLHPCQVLVTEGLAALVETERHPSLVFDRPTLLDLKGKGLSPVRAVSHTAKGWDSTRASLLSLYQGVPESVAKWGSWGEQMMSQGCTDTLAELLGMSDSDGVHAFMDAQCKLNDPDGATPLETIINQPWEVIRARFDVGATLSKGSLARSLTHLSPPTPTLTPSPTPHTLVTPSVSRSSLDTKGEREREGERDTSSGRRKGSGGRRLSVLDLVMPLLGRRNSNASPHGTPKHRQQKDRDMEMQIEAILGSSMRGGTDAQHERYMCPTQMLDAAVLQELENLYTCVHGSPLNVSAASGDTDGGTDPMAEVNQTPLSMLAAQYRASTSAVDPGTFTSFTSLSDMGQMGEMQPPRTPPHETLKTILRAIPQMMRLGSNRLFRDNLFCAMHTQSKLERCFLWTLFFCGLQIFFLQDAVQATNRFAYRALIMQSDHIVFLQEYPVLLNTYLGLVYVMGGLMVIRPLLFILKHHSGNMIVCRLLRWTLVDERTVEDVSQDLGHRTGLLTSLCSLMQKSIIIVTSLIMVCHITILRMGLNRGFEVWQYHHLMDGSWVIVVCMCIEAFVSLFSLPAHRAIRVLGLQMILFIPSSVVMMSVSQGSSFMFMPSLMYLLYSILHTVQEVVSLVVSTSFTVSTIAGHVLVSRVASGRFFNRYID
ncbi:hypothetical protein KIPB_006419, partial [Kipferlia bialata]